MHVEDCSPILKYIGSWVPGSFNGDPLAERNVDFIGHNLNLFWLFIHEVYSMVSQVQGFSVSFQFYGSSTVVVGVKHSNHGSYHGEIYGSVFPQLNGSATPEAFNQTLLSGQAVSEKCDPQCHCGWQFQYLCYVRRVSFLPMSLWILNNPKLVCCFWNFNWQTLRSLLSHIV